MPNDLGELENLVVKKEAALHRFTSVLLSMACHVDPFSFLHLFKNAFDRRLFILQAYYIEAAGQLLHLPDFVLRFRYWSRVRRRGLGDSKNRKRLSHIRRR